MCNASLNVSVSLFRSRVVAWMLLTIFSCSFLPSISLAQQPTATISALNGNVLVNGQKQDKGTVLSAGDILETQAGASVVLELSDGSQLELGEKTNVEMIVLSETATGARVSRITLMWGWVRAKLSSSHQQAGSSFDIETPNALVGVKFSEPDIEVSYNPESVETVGIAHTVELMAKNLLTDEEKLVPIGSTVIIVGMTIKIMAGAAVATGAVSAGTAGTGATSTGTTSTATAEGMGTGTKVAIGTGAVAAAGGIAALAIISSEEGEKECFFSVYSVAENGVIHVSEGTRCTLNISTGFNTEAEAINGLSEISFEITINGVALQPQGAPGIAQDSIGWHVYQNYQTEKLQKGSYNVRGTIYNIDLGRLVDSREFTIQVD